jgi:anhydro-N-acetylmuramic acid kinase
MSGTSADAIDAVLVSFDPNPKLLFALAIGYPQELRAQILRIGLSTGATSLQEIGALDIAIGQQFASAATELLLQSCIPMNAVRAIGSHGQTLWHAPRAKLPFTIQLGDPNVIAELTGIDTVADFRRRDVAAGGEGAPLVPAFHAAFLHSATEHRAVLNLGGIANLSILSCTGVVRGFDTGPANTLLDLWMEQHHAQPFDGDGAFAASGNCDNTLLARMLDDPYFSLPAPKSTGRDYFNSAWLARHLESLSLNAQDVQASLLALTARTVADALKREGPDTQRLLVCGGGARNTRLLAAIAAEIPQIIVEPTHRYGIDTDYLEAMAFAWLARESIAGRPGNLPEVTGARGPRILGGIYRA